MPREIKGSLLQRRDLRQRLLMDTDWLSIRHRDQDEGGLTSSLTRDQYQALLMYRQALRDWPVSGDAAEAFPLPPDFITKAPSPASSL